MSRALLTSVMAAAISSCATESAAPPPLRETLPNGALVVRHPDLPDIDAAGPDVAEAHVDLRFGSLDGDDPNLLFGDIRGIQATSDGTIYVLDHQASEVRVFDSDGRYLRTIVRQGEGPGEITAANGIILSGDSLLWIHDHGEWRIVGVDLDGEQVRQFNKPVLRYGAMWNGVFDNRGRYWRYESHSDEERPYPPPHGWSTSTSRRYYKYHNLSDGAVDSVSLGERISRSYYHHYRDPNGRLRFLRRRFVPYEAIEVNPSGGFWRANTEAYRIVRTGEGGDTVLVIEAGVPAMPVTDEDRSAYIEENVEDRPEARGAAEAVAALLPDFKPVLSRMFVDDEGRLWVQRRTPADAPAFFDMFSEDGDYLGSVHFAFTPAFTDIFWVQHGNIYTWVVDEMDVQYVVRARWNPLSRSSRHNTKAEVPNASQRVEDHRGGISRRGVASAGGAQPRWSFSFERVDAVVGSPTNAIRASDLNADGRLDLVVSGGQRVFVLTGRGDGRFDPSWSGAAGENPSDLAIADLDEDGLADLAVANHETDYVTLLFGIGGGGFEHRNHSRFRVNVSPHPHAVRLHDTNADGHADLLVDDRSPGSIRLFPGRGDGTFSRPTMIDVGGDPYRGMTLADVTGDGLADLLTPNPDHVAVVAADEDGGFRPRATLPAPFGPFSVVAADLDGDGRRDVAAASGEGRGTLATWHGMVDGSFRAAGRYEIARGPTKSAAADLTGDGRAEVIVACYAGGEIAVLIGGGTTLVHRIEVGGNPYGLATGDFDGDGRVDFAVANDGGDYVSVFLTR